MVDSIQRFFQESLEQRIGDLKASLVLDFCLREIGPTIHNRAIRRAQAFLLDNVSDLDNTCYEVERVYWKK